MNWAASVDGYCERVVAGFGAEPFNMLTALSFLAVGMFVMNARQMPDVRRTGLALAVVGVASALSHALATVLTMWADVAANLVYLTLLGVLMLRRLAGAGIAAAAAGATVAVALVFCLGQSLPVRAAIGQLSDMFLLLMLLLVAIALALRASHPETALQVVLAAAVLAVGLPFRFLDEALCPSWPAGTHGFWHLFHACSIAILLSALARHRNRSDSSLVLAKGLTRR